MKYPISTPIPIPGLTHLSPTSTTSPAPGVEGNIRFAFEITNISGSGLTRTATAKLTNTGTGDAHNVWGKTEAFTQGAKIKLGSKEYLRTEIGLLPAGATVTTEATSSFSVMDGLKVSIKKIVAYRSMCLESEIST